MMQHLKKMLNLSLASMMLLCHSLIPVQALEETPPITPDDPEPSVTYSNMVIECYCYYITGTPEDYGQIKYGSFNLPNQLSYYTPYIVLSQSNQTSKLIRFYYYDTSGYFFNTGTDSPITDIYVEWGYVRPYCPVS